MNLSSQVSSLELSRRLKELNVKQDSFWYWQDGNIFNGDEGWKLGIYGAFNEEGQIAAYTTGELGEMLPPSIISEEKEKHLQFAKLQNGKHRVAYYSLYAYAPKRGYMSEKTEADARAKMLIYLIENDLISKTNAAVFGGKEI